MFLHDFLDLILEFYDQIIPRWYYILEIYDQILEKINQIPEYSAKMVFMTKYWIPESNFPIIPRKWRNIIKSGTGWGSKHE